MTSIDPVVLRKKEIFARSLRMSSVVCFVFLIFSSNKYFEGKTNTLAFWNILPGPIVASITISFVLALGAQIWLRGIMREQKRVLGSDS